MSQFIEKIGWDCYLYWQNESFCNLLFAELRYVPPLNGKISGNEPKKQK